ncbi:CUZD1 [Branchiostoma lanceolatum]|uniref:CUZD1 protein n=1 Tax=Branchiostoma lanceolatum TaxID=7740 RepID=A0A8K0ECX6_BRALA|nr:CUZD1 [Branchiostoma lanceolatum]
MYGADIDQLRVLVGSSVEWIRSNNQGNSWHQASVDVYIFYDQIVFEGFGGNGYRGDIAIDDVDDDGENNSDNRFIATYSNTLTINLNASSAIKIDVECHLLSSKVVTVNFNQQSVYKSRVVGRGEFIVSMELYMSDSFRSPVSEYPLYVEFGQMLYVQLHVTSDDTNLHVFADHCWVTPTELNYGPYDSEEDYIIRGGCVRHSTVRYDSPSTMEDRFGFRAFPPTRTTRKMYLQCEVLLCDVTNSSSRCAQGCIEDMYRWKRETEGDTEVYQLIRGPIVLVELNSNQTDREDVSRSHAVSLLPSFMGACAVMVVVAMLIVI